MNFNAENSLTKATRIYSGGRTTSARNGAGPTGFACDLLCGMLPPAAQGLCRAAC